MDTRQIVDELEAERDRLDAAIAALQDGAKRRKRPPLSAEARKRIGDAQKKRWAARKRASKKA